MSAPETRAEAARLLMTAVQAHEANDLARARSLYESVLALAPEQADALHLLGVIADQQGRHEDAVALIRRAIARSPQAAAFHGNLGTALLALGDMAAAEEAYRQALALDPFYVEAHVNYGNLLRRKGDGTAAALQYRQALARDARNADALFGLAGLLVDSGQYEEAIRHLTIAVQGKPQAAELRDLVALALRHLGRYEDALLHHRKALAFAPDNLSYRENYATTLTKISTPDAYQNAVDEFEAVLAVNPDRINALVGLGAALVKHQRPLEAMAPLRRALDLGGDRIEALVNLSVGLAYEGRFNEALDCCERAVRLAPDDCLILTHRGTVYEHLGDYEAALADYAAAIEASSNRNPITLADAQMKHALMLLSMGRLAEGWPRYIARQATSRADLRGRVVTSLLPVWDGVVRADQNILVWGEQGIGDEVLYAGMLPELAARGASFRVASEPRLVDLFRRSFPGIDIQPATKASLDEFARAADVQIGLGDLGMHLRPTLTDFPPPRAYLRPDAALVEEFRRRYAGYGRRLTVGLMWRSKNLFNGLYKSVPLVEWGQVLRQQDVLFVDMQYGDTASELRETRERLGVDILHDDSVDATADLDRYAAQAAALDLVISVSNSGLHIAAATGCTCWALLPSGVGRLWYWLLDREDSPWYPHLRLFRQAKGCRSDDWEATLGRVGAALAARLADGSR